MNSTTVRRVAVSTAMVTALTGLVACRSSDSADGPSEASTSSGRDGSALTALRAAEKSTDAADSARVRSMTVLGTGMSMKADGALGWRDGVTGTVTITYTGGTAATLMRKLGTTSMEARYLPDAYYAKMGEKFADRTGGKHWIRYAYDDLDALGGSSGAVLGDQMKNTTPHQTVKLLLASGDVRRIGEEQVRGEHTTHYSGSVEVPGLATKTTETVDIWVDDRDLLVKKVEKGRTDTGELTQTAYYSDYGVKVSAEKPPAGDTADFKALLKKQSGSPATS